MQPDHNPAQDKRYQAGKSFCLIVVWAEQERYFGAARNPRSAIRAGQNAELVLARRNVSVVSRSMIIRLAPILFESIQPVPELNLLGRDEARRGKAKSQFPGARRGGEGTIRGPLLVVNHHA